MKKIFSFRKKGELYDTADTFAQNQLRYMQRRKEVRRASFSFKGISVFNLSAFNVHNIGTCTTSVG